MRVRPRASARDGEAAIAAEDDQRFLPTSLDKL